MKKLLLISNSTMPGEPFFTWPRQYLVDFLKGSGPVAFLPYAGVSLGMDKYFDIVERMLGQLAIDSFSLHHEKDPIAALDRAGAIMTGGGNSFCLARSIQQLSLVEKIRDMVDSGTPYVGWSAGANVACPTIKTTNDMPIVEVTTLEAFRLVHFQINPHYTEATLPDHGGESRIDRLKEFLIMNPKMRVAGLPEGSLLRIEGNQLTVHGKAIKVFEAPDRVTEYAEGSRLSLTLAPLAE
ncbi:MAG: dipeptidase PepE [Flavobacteriales bacterium]|nr:dipeptidase PepE [Flavobacteriales bacterium]